MANVRAPALDKVPGKLAANTCPLRPVEVGGEIGKLRIEQA
jgi:hypothetical protein